MKNKLYTLALSATSFIAATLLVSHNTHAQGLVINTVAGTGTSGFSGDGGAATAATFNSPAGVKVDASGNIFVADYLNHRIRKISATGTISTVAGSSAPGFFAGDGGPASSARLFQPADIAPDGSGNLYIADCYNHRIRKVDASGTITTIAGSSSTAYTGDGGAATAATMGFPVSICTDAAGDVFFSDDFNNVVRKITVSTGIISRVAGTGTAGFSGDGAAATAATLNQPKGIFVDASGNVYIADRDNQRIRKVSTTGIITTIAGIGSIGATGDGGPATAAYLNNPYGVCMDAAGNLLFSDSWNYKIRKIDASGNLSSIAGTGTFGFSGDGGAATAAKINTLGITLDPSTGKIYLADNGNQRIRVLQPAPLSVTGTATICEGKTTTLTGSIAGGTWTSGSTANATVDASGVVTGVAAGTATISYVVAAETATKIVSINISPAAISGTPTVCIAATTLLANSVSGGSWASFNPAVASIDATGLVSGVSVDTVTIGYFFLTGCFAKQIVTVDPCITQVATLTHAPESLNVYPNPSYGSISLEIPGSSTNADITITDVLGKIVITQLASLTGTRTVTLSNPGLPAGSYFVKVLCNGQFYRGKLNVAQ